MSEESLTFIKIDEDYLKKWSKKKFISIEKEKLIPLLDLEVEYVLRLLKTGLNEWSNFESERRLNIFKENIFKYMVEEECFEVIINKICETKYEVHYNILGYEQQIDNLSKELGNHSRDRNMKYIWLKIIIFFKNEDFDEIEPFDEEDLETEEHKHLYCPYCNGRTIDYEMFEGSLQDYKINEDHHLIYIREEISDDVICSDELDDIMNERNISLDEINQFRIYFYRGNETSIYSAELKACYIFVESVEYFLNSVRMYFPLSSNENID